MKKSKIFILVSLILICLSACNDSLNFSNETGLVSSSVEISSTNLTDETVEKVEVGFEPNYGVYSSLIDAYEVTAHQTYDGSPSYIDEAIYDWLYEDATNYLGVNYKLVDFDGNGVFEFVVSALNITTPEDISVVLNEKEVTKIFTINSENELVFVDSFQLFNEESYSGTSQSSFVTTEVDGETYVISGYTTEYIPSVNYKIWRYNDAGFDLVTSLSADINTDTYEYENALIDESEATHEEANQFLLKWLSQSTFSTCVGGNEEYANANVLQPMNEALEFLSDYEKADGDFGDAVFSEGKYVIFEAKPQNEAEELVKQYFKDCVLPNNNYLNYTEATGYIFNKFDSFPCCIVRDFSTVIKDDFGVETINLKEQLSSEEMKSVFDKYGAENEFAVRVETESFIDYDVLQLDPQSGYGENTDWIILGEKSNSISDYTIFASLGTSDTMWNLDMTDAFEVVFLEYRENLVDEEGFLTLESIYDKSKLYSLDYYLTLEEILQTELVDDFKGNEIYLIKSSDDYEFGVSTEEYDENGEVTGIQEIGTYNMPIILSCNSYGISSDVNVTVTYPSGNSYSYSPSVKTTYYAVDYGDYAKPFELINEPKFTFTATSENEINDSLNGTWSIDGEDDTAYIEICDGYYVSYYPTGVAESYASFGYDGVFFDTARYSLYQEGEFTGTQFYYVKEDTIMLQNCYGDWPTFKKK